MLVELESQERRTKIKLGKIKKEKWSYSKHLKWWTMSKTHTEKEGKRTCLFKWQFADKR